MAFNPQLGGVFSLTGGPTSKAGAMADSGGVTEAFGALRKKSSGLNKLPGLGLELGAKRYEADQYADMMDTRAYWDTKKIDAKYDSQAKQYGSQGNNALMGGALKGFAGVAMAALPLLASDGRVKHTVTEIDNAVSLLRQLRPVSYYYNEGYGSDSDRLHYGFIAQEYAEHMPDATYLDEENDMLCINTMELIGLLVKANQELEQRITRLEAKEALAGAVR